MDQVFVQVVLNWVHFTSWRMLRNHSRERKREENLKKIQNYFFSIETSLVSFATEIRLSFWENKVEVVFVFI